MNNTKNGTTKIGAKNKVYACLSLVVVILMSAVMLAACNHYGPSDKEYWFSSVSRVVVGSYDETTLESNDDPGTFWTFVSNRNENITLSLKTDADMFSTIDLSVNGVFQNVQSDSNNFYSVIYNLSLKKGDVIKFSIHGSVLTQEFNIQVMNINGYLIENL